MKINYRINCCLVLSFLVFCSFFTNKANYQTECVSLETDGYYTIKIWDTKKRDNYRSEDARKDALHAILFSGIAGTNGCVTQKAMLNKLEYQQNFKSIEKDFFAKKGKWSAFTRTATTATTLPVAIGNQKWKVYQISISKSALSQYLEELKIIQTLNNQF
jgi:hypothetical protein